MTDFSKCPVVIESEIENMDLSCRVHTECGTTVVVGKVFLGGVGLIAAAAIAANNFAPFNSAYDIGDNKINSTVSVNYKK